MVRWPQTAGHTVQHTVSQLLSYNLTGSQVKTHNVENQFCLFSLYGNQLSEWVTNRNISVNSTNTVRKHKPLHLHVSIGIQNILTHISRRTAEFQCTTYKPTQTEGKYANTTVSQSTSWQNSEPAYETTMFITTNEAPLHCPLNWN